MPNPLFIAPHANLLHTCDPRLRILAAFLFALATANLTQLWVAGLALGLAMGLAWLSGNLRTLSRRLWLVEGLMLLLLVSLPFTTPGTTLLAFGYFHVSSAGFYLAGLIVLKANAIVLTLLCLVGSLEPSVFGHALARLGVPLKLVHLLLLSLRQIHLLHAEFERLQQAMRARAFVPKTNLHTWRSYGYLIGMLLVRSWARSQRIAAAMRCRGFQGRLYLLDIPHWKAVDTFYALLVLGVCVSLVSLDWWS